MKLRSLCSATLLSTLALGMMIPMGVNAEEVTAKEEAQSLSGTGTIKYEEDNDTNKPKDPEEIGDGDKDITGDITENTKGGPITIDLVSNLNFGIRKVSATPEAKIYEASPVTLTKTDSEGTQETVERGNYIQWTDKRAGNDHSYEVKAALTKQFTTSDGKNQLKAAEITFNNGLLNSDALTTNWPTDPIKSITVTENGEKDTLLTNAVDETNTSRGLGTYTVEFGTSTADITNQKNEKSSGLANNSVLLKVPGGQSIVAQEYKAEVTWSIEYTPEPKAETPEVPEVTE